MPDSPEQHVTDAFDDKPVRMVAGFCRRTNCGKAFTVPMSAKAWNTITTKNTWPLACSPTCATSMSRQRRDARLKKEKEETKAAALAARKPAEWQPIPVRWAVLCRTCWTRVPDEGELICLPCMDTIRRCCIGKSRFRTGEDAKRYALVRRDSAGEAIFAYRCPVCTAWHLGHVVSRARAKQIRFMAGVFVDSMSPQEYAELCKRWAPVSRKEFRRRVLKKGM